MKPTNYQLAYVRTVVGSSGTTFSDNVVGTQAYLKSPCRYVD